MDIKEIKPKDLDADSFIEKQTKDYFPLTISSTARRKAAGSMAG